MATTERLVLPPNTTQEQRIRIRNSFRLTPQNWFYTAEPFTINLTNEKNDLRKHMMPLPSNDILRRDPTSVVEGKRVSVGVDIGGRGCKTKNKRLKKKTKK